VIRRPRRAQDLAEVVAQDDARLDSRIMRGSAWVAVSYGGRNVVSLLTTLALVRLLEPRAFGLVALAWTVLMVTDQVQNAGAAAALVYRRTDVERAAASAFLFVLCSGAVLFGVALLLAPLFASLFHTPELTSVLRVMALLLITRAFGTIPLALLERNIDFRKRSPRPASRSGSRSQASASGASSSARSPARPSNPGSPGRSRPSIPTPARRASASSAGSFATAAT